MKGSDPLADGGQGPQVRSSLYRGMQPAAFTSTWKAASGRLDPPHVALFGPSVVTQAQRHNPRRVALGAWLDPSPGGKSVGDVTPGRWRPGSSSPIKPVSQNATRSLHAHLEGCFGEAGPPCVALFGPSVVTQLQR